MSYPFIVPPEYENRWVEMKDEDYHADKKAVNSSSLREMVKSPMAYLEAYRFGSDATKAMEMGKRAHLAILEGQKFIDLHVVEPEFWGLTQKGERTNSLNCTQVKNKKSEWYEALTPGSVVVTQEELDTLLRMIDSIVTHPVAFPILSKGKSEVKGYYRDPKTGLLCRAMIDFISFELNYLVDLKTTVDCRWFKFRKSVEDLRYDFQMAMYREATKIISGKEPDGECWIAISNKAPYEVMVHDVDEVYRATGAYEYRKSLDRLAECIKLEKFPPAQVVPEPGAPTSWFIQDYQLRGVL